MQNMIIRYIRLFAALTIFQLLQLDFNLFKLLGKTIMFVNAVVENVDNNSNSSNNNNNNYNNNNSNNNNNNIDIYNYSNSNNNYSSYIQHLDPKLISTHEKLIQDGWWFFRESTSSDEIIYLRKTTSIDVHTCYDLKTSLLKARKFCYPAVMITVSTCSSCYY